MVDEGPRDTHDQNTGEQCQRPFHSLVPERDGIRRAFRKANALSLWSVFVVGVGVSADAFAAALTSGLRTRTLLYRQATIIALTFAGFQAAMPLAGWLLASQFARFVDPVDHWIAFGLLSLIGGKMIWDAIAGDGDDHGDHRVGVRRLLVLGFATSVDAAAVGVSFAMLEVSILQAVLVIGLITLVLSFAAVLIGHRVGVRFRRPAELIGGLVLIAIGARILLEHFDVFV